MSPLLPKGAVATDIVAQAGQGIESVGEQAHTRCFCLDAWPTCLALHGGTLQLKHRFLESAAVF